MDGQLLDNLETVLGVDHVERLRLHGGLGGQQGVRGEGEVQVSDVVASLLYVGQGTTELDLTTPGVGEADPETLGVLGHGHTQYLPQEVSLLLSLTHGGGAPACGVVMVRVAS